MPFDAETTCKSLAARVTSLENALKAQAENKVSSKMEALEKTIVALKAADARDTDTVKALKAQSEKQAQALEVAMKKKDSLSIEQKDLERLKSDNDKKLHDLQQSLDKYDKDQKTAFDAILKAEFAKREAEQKAQRDADFKAAETRANQSKADSEKAVAAQIQKATADLQKQQAEMEKSMANIQRVTDTSKLEARLLQLEALVKALSRT